MHGAQRPVAVPPDTLGGILHAVVDDEIRPPEEAAPLLPVVAGLLERDPERRLDAAQAERMLRAFRETGRVPPPRGTGRTPRDRLVTALLVAAMAAVGVGRRAADDRRGRWPRPGARSDAECDGDGDGHLVGLLQYPGEREISRTVGHGSVTAHPPRWMRQCLARYA
ncbi:hypothetical protein SGLAM104S_06586 [Streptomyces glaucescens]